LLGACADTAGEGPERYVVRSNDTLYSIAWRHDLDYRDLARWNNIGADFRIVVGQVLVLGPGRVPPSERGASERDAARAAPKPPPPAMPPGAGAAGSRAQTMPQVGKPRPLPESPAGAGAPIASAPTASAPTAGRPSASAPSLPAAPSRATPSPATPSQAAASQATPSPAAPSASNGALKWVWPTDRMGAPRSVSGGGILLSGRLGQDVRAASAGRVVYTGNGLRGYGNLVIIKHADSLLSAYAHNREMLVHDGQEVATGQVIAHMGEGAHQSPVLYFEIRQNGRPVDPLPFFSKAR
jgi:lipoprotein NlpD